MFCPHFAADRCRSCTLIEVPYPRQLAAKDVRIRAELPAGIEWIEAYPSDEAGFRNKAKLAVAGTTRQPTLGTVAPNGRGTDLRDCALYPDALQAALPALAETVAAAGLVPYDIVADRGDLKFLIVTASPDDELKVRFVLRTDAPVARLRDLLPQLQRDVPGLVVVSINIQPEHKAVLEGPREIVLTQQATLPMRINGLTFHLPPRSFFQTNTEVAAALYRQAAVWIDALAPTTAWDLYCGVGTFAAHAGVPTVGVESSEDAVDAARRSAPAGVTFVAGDAAEFALSASGVPDLVIVNPPRRGIGELAEWLEGSDVANVLYSSCNPVSLARDLAAMPSLTPVRARVFDMFPHTTHAEVLTLLQR